jgi:hypothetical protein
LCSCMLLMMGREMPETCWVTHKRQVINLWNCCILLVELFESYDDARTCEREVYTKFYLTCSHPKVLWMANPHKHMLYEHEIFSTWRNQNIFILNGRYIYIYIYIYIYMQLDVTITTLSILEKITETVYELPTTRIVKKVTEWEPCWSRPVARRRLRWLDQVEEDLKKMKVRNWRENCKDRRLWNKIIKQAKTHQGL